MAVIHEERALSWDKAELVSPQAACSLSRKLAVLQWGWQSCSPSSCWPAVNDG